ncbi:hypothetical protein EVAR_25424_1 [Eumeta japonica]|uniref:Uncharacterized protein n=1 Tax=Eumeta variegata TaxID=151549 RepID=A0A4C1V4S8_EUMVA|nr:hypothetical protein EVAR_25424_1 [Eumeta japonica]
MIGYRQQQCVKRDSSSISARDWKCNQDRDKDQERMKLYHYGVTGRSFGLLEPYLSDRIQRVNINGEISSQSAANMGVPQGRSWTVVSRKTSSSSSADTHRHAQTTRAQSRVEGNVA